MADLELTVIPRDLYSHEVAYVRGLEAELAEARAQIAAKDAALRKIADAPAWGHPDKWETTPAEVRQLAREALSTPRNEVSTDLDQARSDGNLRGPQISRL